MSRVPFEQINNAALAAGLRLKCCQSGHWQLIGGISIVNVYNGKSGTTIYVQGTSKGRKISSAAEAISAARKVPALGSLPNAGRKNYGKTKRHKWKRSKACHWCKKPFGSFDECTADHVIPLSKGGSNGTDNIVLACKECNDRRQNNVSADEIRSVRSKSVIIKAMK